MNSIQTIENAFQKFVENRTGRNCSHATIKSYKNLLPQLHEFCNTSENIEVIGSRFYEDFIFVAALTLIWVMSMKTVLGDRYSACVTSPKIHAKIWSTVSAVKR